MGDLSNFKNCSLRSRNAKRVCDKVYGINMVIFNINVKDSDLKNAFVLLDTNKGQSAIGLVL